MILEMSRYGIVKHLWEDQSRLRPWSVCIRASVLALRLH